MLDLQKPEEEIVFNTNSEQELDLEESEASDKEPEEVYTRLIKVWKTVVQMNIADTKGILYASVSFKNQVQQDQ